MTAGKFRRTIRLLGLTSQKKAAEWLGVSLKTSHRYANGDPIPEATAKLLRLMLRLGLKPEDVK